MLGTVLVWAATEPQLRQAGLDPHTYLKKAALWAVLGLILMFVTASIDYRRIRRWTPVLYGLSLLLLLAVLAVGQSVNGAKAWIALPGGFQVEPSEFAKLGLILSAAWLLSRRNAADGPPDDQGRVLRGPGRRPADRPGREGAGPRRHPGPGLHAGRHDRAYPASGSPGCSAASLASPSVIYAIAKLHLLKGYQLTRLTAFLHPEQDLAGAGYNGLQAKIAVGSGGLYGQGLFHGTFTGGNFVPSVQTDFIFTVAGEELGFVGCAVIVALLVVHRVPRDPRRPARRRHVRHAGGVRHSGLVRLPVLRERRHDDRHHADHGPPAPVRQLRRLRHLRRHDRDRPPPVRKPPPPPSSPNPCPRTS